MVYPSTGDRFCHVRNNTWPGGPSVLEPDSGVSSFPSEFTDDGSSFTRSAGCNIIQSDDEYAENSDSQIMDFSVDQIDTALRILSMHQHQLDGDSQSEGRRRRRQRNCYRGLSSISMPTLQLSVQPIVDGLRRIDAVQLLNLNVVSSDTAGAARVDDGYVGT
jgi:hypothetical protein